MLQLQAQRLDAPAEPDDADDDEDICDVWPEHVDAMRLLMACVPMLPVSIGSMGGLIYQSLWSINLKQEMRWLGIPARRQPKLADQYRIAESKYVQILNQRAADSAAKSRTP